MHEVGTASLLPFHLTTILAVCWSASQSRLQASYLKSLISAHQFTASVWGYILHVLTMLVCETCCSRVATNDIAVLTGCGSGDGWPLPLCISGKMVCLCS